MRLNFHTLLLAIGVALPGHAQEAPNPAIRATIQNQITAMEADDFGKAFSYASPTIHDIFRTPENFEAMVRQGYPMVAHPSAVRMLELRAVAGKLWQRVLVTDQAGALHMLDYQMNETPDGWQINAVLLLPQAGVGA